ncbi:MAG TPA: hypothetical protein VEW67_03955 [Thermoleophilaceae bacterium]|nr:hypothetical protein [Thermoleophilaceae bacterium]
MADESRARTRRYRARLAEARAESDAFWADLGRRGQALARRRAEMPRRANGARPALTSAAKRHA